MQRSQHYWRIHARVTRRLWTDLCEQAKTDRRAAQIRDNVARDDAHETEDYKWFAAKVDADTKRLYEDSTHWDNQPDTFLCSKFEDRLAIAA